MPRRLANGSRISQTIRSHQDVMEPAHLVAVIRCLQTAASRATGNMDGQLAGVLAALAGAGAETKLRETEKPGSDRKVMRP
jgi:hypothetical protein